MIELTLSEVAPALGTTWKGQEIKFTGCSIDTRNIKPGTLYVALRGDRFDGHDFVKDAQQKGASAIIVERDVVCDLPTLRVADTRKALGDLASFWRQRFDLPVVAITGSNGKTTTKEMLKTIFTQKISAESNEINVLANQGNLNNDIGVPLTLFNLQANHRYAIIEMGANHAGEIAYLTQMAKPSVATITQCAPAHLEGIKSVEGVALAKGEIFSHLTEGGIAIINNDDAYATLWHELAASHQINTFALENTADVTAKDIQLNEDSSDFILHTQKSDIAIHLPLPGRHNIMNALAASACALACGCSLEIIQPGLQNMQPVKGRLQLHKINGITLIDDTYNANPTSLNAALAILSNYPPPYWLILGDMKELGQKSAEFHQQAGQRAREVGVEHLWAIGDLSRYAVDYFGEGAYHFTNHDELINSLQNQWPTRATLLIKGSRSMQMEKVVNALTVSSEQ